MSKFKHAALALAAASLMAVQAQATEVQAQSPQAVPVATFSQADINTMFEQAGQPMQLAALSGQEMKDTEGAWFWFAPLAVMFMVNAPRITQFGMNMVSTSAYQPWGHAFNWARTQYYRIR